MKKYLLISNKGLLEVEALTLVGASTKVGDKNKIGMFGSGNKYALAYLMRNGHEVKIYSGLEEIKLDSVKKEFRKQEFDVITVNGQETSITTQMGKDWQLWQAIRELYANAIDEGMIHFKECDMIHMGEAADTTQIYISMTGELESFLFNMMDYFAIGKDLVYENEHGRIYRKHSAKACVYRKGIRCIREKENKTSIFDYDFNELYIDENRLAAGSWVIPEAIYRLLSECKDPKIVRELLTGISEDPKVLEGEVDSWYTIKELDAETVKEAMKGKQAVPRSLSGLVDVEDLAKSILLPGKLYNSVVGAGAEESSAFTITGSGLVYQELELDKLQEHMLKDVLYFFQECNFPEIENMEIKLVKFDNPDIFGAIEDGNILLGKSAFDKGKHEVAATLLEEYIHIKSGAADKSRKMQNAILDEFLTYMKNANTFDL